MSSAGLSGLAMLAVQVFEDLKSYLPAPYRCLGCWRAPQMSPYCVHATDLSPGDRSVESVESGEPFS